MKRILFSLLPAFVLTAVLLASLAWGGAPVASAQEMEPGALQVNVSVELAGGEAITLPLAIGEEDLAALLELAPAAAVMEAVTQLAGQEVQTITVAVPAVFTPTEALLRIVSAVAVEAEAEAEPAPPVTTTLTVTVPSPGIDLVPMAASNANLRSSPSTDAAIVGQATAGQALMIQARNVDSSWYQLSDGSWVAAFLVENAPQGLPVALDDETILTQTVPATVTSQALVLRAGPDVDESSLGSYADGTIVAVLGQAPGGEWFEVATPDGLRGWMAADFLELSAPAEEVPESAEAALPVSVSGQVVDEAGEGIGGIVVAAGSPDADEASRVEATTGADGAFVLELAPGSTGTWTVEIAGVGCDSRIVNDRCQLFGYFAATPAVEVDLPAEEPVTLAYAEAVSFIAGSVVDAEGNALEGGIRVVGEREDGARTSGETSSTGKFVLPAAAGVWTVSVEGGPALEVEVPERSAPEPVELTLE